MALVIGRNVEMFMPLADIQTRVEAACQKAGRALHDVELIAVSKVQPMRGWKGY